MTPPKIGLALSGGGARAIAFHLGCLRALHDRGILEKIDVLSGVSGGSVIAALYAYSDEPFEEFERRIERTLANGMVKGIARELFFSTETLKVLMTIVTAGLLALLGRIVQLVLLPLGWVKLQGVWLSKLANRLSAPLPRFASRTTAFERHLKRRYFGDRKVDDVRRGNFHVVINAAELRTESAFRFGSLESGCWRFGRLTKSPAVSKAVAASAAFPVFLPAIDTRLQFEKDGHSERHRVQITDGGVYDNLGISCMLPGRDKEFSTNAFAVDFIIACDAGLGIPPGTRRSYFWGSRMLATILTIHRRTQSMSQSLLHRMAASGEIQGFLLPYLGMIDDRLPARSEDLVSREQVVDYPTNFNPMSELHVKQLSQRGEQITAALIDHYAPHL